MNMWLWSAASSTPRQHHSAAATPPGRRLAIRWANKSKVCTDAPKLDVDPKREAPDAWEASGWCKCGLPCPDVEGAASTSVSEALATPVLVIGAEIQCFERTRALARAAGLHGKVAHVPATFVSSDEIVEKCCRRGDKVWCGKGSRLKPAARAVMDGGMQAHRRVWEVVRASGVAHIVLEDDVRLLGRQADLACAAPRGGPGFKLLGDARRARAPALQSHITSSHIACMR